MRIAHPLRRDAAGKIIGRLIRQHRDLAVEQRHIDMRALICDATTSQRRKDRDRRIHAGKDIGVSDPRLLRRSVGFAGQRHKAAHRLHDIIIAGTMRIRPGLAEAGDRTDDQPRKIGAQPRGIKPIFDQPADLVILDDDIGVGKQRAYRRLPLGARDVDRHAALAAVAAVIIGRTQIFAIGAGDERRTPLARIVACPRPLDLDHLGTEIGEQLPAPRPREHPRQFDHADALQRF